jgi:hypothetical protein
VDPVPDPLLLRKSGGAGNQPGTSRAVARNSDHETTEAVYPQAQWIIYIPLSPVHPNKETEPISEMQSFK